MIWKILNRPFYGADPIMEPFALSIASTLPALLSVGGSLLANKSAQNATKAQNSANAALAQQQNAYNLDLFNRARGSDGNAILPLYAGNAESGLFSDVIDLSEVSPGIFGTPEDRARADQGIVDSVQPGVAAGTAFTNDLLTGGILGERQGALAPVTSAREARVPLLQAAHDEAVAATEGVNAARSDLGGVQAARLAPGLAQARSNLGGVEAARLDPVRAEARALGSPALQAYLEQELQGIEGVNAERLRAVDAAREGLNLTRQAEENRIRAANVGNGLFGGSTQFNSALARNSFGATQALAEAEAAARLTNAQDRGRVNFGSVGLLEADNAVRNAEELFGAGLANAGDRYASGVANAEEARIARLANAEELYDAQLQNATDRGALRESDVGLLANEIDTQNAIDRQGLVESDVQARAAGLSLPFAQARNAIGLTDLPAQGIYDDQLALQNALNFFRLGEGRAPQAVNRAPIETVPGAGSVIGSQIATAGSGILGNRLSGGETNLLKLLFGGG